VIRIGIRRQLAQRCRLIKKETLASTYERTQDYIDALRQRPIAINTADANTQHYEVGPAFSKLVSGHA